MKRKDGKKIANKKKQLPKKKIKKQKPEPTLQEKLAKHESQMIKRICDMEKLEVKCVKKLVKAAKKAKDFDLDNVRRRIRQLEKEINKVGEDPPPKPKPSKQDLSKKIETLKAVRESAKGVTPESIAAIVFKDLPKPTIKLPRSDVGEAHRKRQREETGEDLPSPPTTQVPAAKQDQPKKLKKEVEPSKDESDKDSSEEESSSEEDSEDESSQEEGKKQAKEDVKEKAGAEKPALTELPLAVVEDKASSGVGPYNQRIIEKEEFQVRLKDMEKVLTRASHKTAVFVEKQAKMVGDLHEQARAAGLDPATMVVPDYLPGVAAKFNPRGKLGKKYMKQERKFKGRMKARAEAEAKGLKRKADAAAAAAAAGQDTNPSGVGKKQKVAANATPSGQ